MTLNDFTAEQIEKARACKTPEELLELVKAEGIELSDNDLQAVTGGLVLPGGSTGDDLEKANWSF